MNANTQQQNNFTKPNNNLLEWTYVRRVRSLFIMLQIFFTYNIKERKE